jgi:transposase
LADGFRSPADERQGSFSTDPASLACQFMFASPANLVEQFFNKVKQCRWVATRYDNLAANDLAFIQLASIRLRLRVNESTS